MPPQFDVAGVGLNATDTLLAVPRFPPYAGKVPFEEEIVSPGGQVASATAACARLGLHHNLAARRGVRLSCSYVGGTVNRTVIRSRTDAAVKGKAKTKGRPLALKMKPGVWRHHRECHVRPDWRLICKVTPGVLTLMRRGAS